MAYKANDGSGFTNRGGMVKHNSKLAAKAPAAKAAPSAALGQVDDGVNADAGQEGILQDPQAMQALDVLVQKGYTAEEISQAVEQLQGAGEPDGDEGQAAPSGMMG